MEMGDILFKEGNGTLLRNTERIIGRLGNDYGVLEVRL